MNRFIHITHLKTIKQFVLLLPLVTMLASCSFLNNMASSTPSYSQGSSRYSSSTRVASNRVTTANRNMAARSSSSRTAASSRVAASRRTTASRATATSRTSASRTSTSRTTAARTSAARSTASSRRVTNNNYSDNSYSDNNNSNDNYSNDSYSDEEYSYDSYSTPEVKYGAAASSPDVTFAEATKSSRKLGLQVVQNDNLQLMVEAASWVGSPYLTGGVDRDGVDCSGLVCAIYANVYGAFYERMGSEGLYQECCDPVNASELQQGDLVFFTTDNSEGRVGHCGIYLKDGKFIHASTSKGVTVSSLTEQYWVKHWYAGGKVK